MAVKKKAAKKASKPTAAQMRDVYLRMSFEATEALIAKFDDLMDEIVTGAKTEGISMERGIKAVFGLIGSVGTARDALVVARRQTGI
jgi:hypothetical protein